MAARQACHDEEMSETFTIRMESGPDMRYASGAFDRDIGSTTPVRVPGGGTAEGTIRAAVVSDDGSEVELTIEVPDGTLPKQRLSGFSLRNA